MPKHRPIYFKDQTFSEGQRKSLKQFIDRHPIAASISKVILATAVLGGVITVAAVAPGIVRVLEKGYAARKREQKERYRKLWERFYTMKKRGIFELKKEGKDGSLVYQFTERGRMITRKFLLGTLSIQKPEKWDGKWRIITFDIPEKYNKARRAFQEKLCALNCYPLQKSVLVHPFPCEVEVQFLKDLLQINPFVEIFIADEMPNGKVVHYFSEFLKDF